MFRRTFFAQLCQPSQLCESVCGSVFVEPIDRHACMDDDVIAHVRLRYQRKIDLFDNTAKFNPANPSEIGTVD